MLVIKDKDKAAVSSSGQMRVLVSRRLLLQHSSGVEGVTNRETIITTQLRQKEAIIVVEDKEVVEVDQQLEDRENVDSVEKKVRIRIKMICSYTNQI
jgi:hypothetical protein